jgi:two-component system chemotaxis response regulator CheY
LRLSGSFAENGGEGGGMKLLIVDDSMIVRSVIERNTGHVAIKESFQADNGVTALQLYSEHLPELITMDLTMPHLDGLACLREIQAMGRSPSVLVISALNSHQTAMQAVANGACGFLVKPFTPLELVDAIEQLVQHAQNEATP